MEKLPNELHCEIFTYLEFEDLRAVRLTCKSLAEKAAPMVLDRVTVSIQRKSLEMYVRPMIGTLQGCC